MDLHGERDGSCCRCREPCGGGLVRDAEGALLPLDVVPGQGAELRDPEYRIQQGPDDQLLLEAPAGVGEAIGLFGPEGLADELVGHLLTGLAARSVRSRPAIGSSVLLSPDQGVGQAADGDNSRSCSCFRPTWPTRRCGGGNLCRSSRSYTEGELREPIRGLLLSDISMTGQVLPGPTVIYLRGKPFAAALIGIPLDRGTIMLDGNAHVRSLAELARWARYSKSTGPGS